MTWGHFFDNGPEEAEVPFEPALVLLRIRSNEIVPSLRDAPLFFQKSPQDLLGDLLGLPARLPGGPNT